MTDVIRSLSRSFVKRTRFCWLDVHLRVRSGITVAMSAKLVSDLIVDALTDGAIMRWATPQIASLSYAVKMQSLAQARISTMGPVTHLRKRRSSQISSRRATLLMKTICLPRTLILQIGPG